MKKLLSIFFLFVFSFNVNAATNQTGQIVGSSGILQGASGGTGANNTTTTTGTQLRSNGTAFVPSTTTYPDTNAINTIPYASSANVFGSIAAANNGLLQTSATGVPSYSTSQTYSAVIGDGTNNFTGITSNSSYYREGARTCVNIDVAWTGKGSANSGSTVRLSLPITSSSTPFSNPFTFGFVNGITASTQIFAFNNGTENYAQMVNFVSGSSATSITVGNLATAGRIQLYGCIGS